jgi:UDP-N-acetylglucosamine 2-epimerase (non-hydrolysing)
LAAADVVPPLASAAGLVKVLVVMGTRPEGIKLAPLILELRRRPNVALRVVTTGQHRALLDQALATFAIVPDDDLDVMRPEQSLADLSGRVLSGMDRLLGSDPPDVLLVQGDTTSAFMCGLAAWYRHVPVAHVEAGLRTGSLVDPFPEEMNRLLIARLASIHFAPTARARAALLAEGVPDDTIFVTGNTVVDALLHIRNSDEYKCTALPVPVDQTARLLLVTLHRRESWGAPLGGMCRALRTILEMRPDVRMVFPVHANPVVERTVHAALGDNPRIDLIQPVDYLTFVRLMDASWLVLTDSGGVQEEAPVLGRPVLVLRETTERPEAVECGVARAIGTDPDAIVRLTVALLDNPVEHAQMARAVSPFGDGRAAARIADILEARIR